MRDIIQDTSTVIAFYRKWIRVLYNSEYSENVKYELNREHSNTAIDDECNYLKIWLESD